MEVRCAKHDLILTNNHALAPYFCCNECYKDYAKAHYPGFNISQLTIGYGPAIAPVIIIDNSVTAFQGLELTNKYREYYKTN